MKEYDRVFLHVLVYPTSSNVEDFNLDNNWQTLDLKDILVHDDNLDADLRVVSFKVPDFLQGEVEVYADIFIQSYSTGISRLSYSIEFWYSLHDNYITNTLDTGLSGYASGDNLNKGENGFHIVSDLYSFPTPTDNRFCGDIFLMIIVSFSDDLTERNMQDNFMSQPVFRTCTDDVFAISNPAIHLLPQLYADVSTDAVLSFNVTCVMHPYCNIPRVPKFDQTNYEVEVNLALTKNNRKSYTHIYTVDGKDAANTYPSLREPFYTPSDKTPMRLFFKIPLLLQRNLVCTSTTYVRIELETTLKSTNQLNDKITNNQIFFDITEFAADLCNPIGLRLEVSEFSANFYDPFVYLGSRIPFAVTIEALSLDGTKLQNPTSQIGLRFFVGSVKNPLISTRNFHLGYNLPNSAVQFHKKENDVWSVIYNDTDGVYLNHTSLIDKCGEMIYLCSAVGGIHWSHVDEFNIHTAENELGIGGPVSCLKFRAMCKNNAIALREFGILQTCKVPVSHDYSLQVDIGIQNVGDRFINLRGNGDGLDFNFHLSTDSILDNDDLLIYPVINVTESESYMYSQQLNPFGYFTVTGARMELRIPEHFCRDILHVLLSIEHPQDTEAIDNHKSYPIKVDCDFVRTPLMFLSAAKTSGEIFIEKESLESKPVVRSGMVSVELKTGITPQHGLLDMEKLDLSSIILTFVLTSNEDIDYNDERLLIMSMSGAILWKSSKILFATAESPNVQIDMIINQFVYEMATFNLKYCGNPFIGIQISEIGRSDFLKLSEKELFVRKNVTCTYDVFKLVDGSFKFIPFSTPLYPGITSKVKLEIEMECIADYICSILKDSSHEGWLATNVFFKLWLSSDINGALDVINLETIDNTWLSSPTLSSGFDRNNYIKKYIVDGTIVIPITDRCTRQRYVHVEILPGSSSFTSSLDPIVVENNRATDNFNILSCDTVEYINLSPKFGINYILYPSLDTVDAEIHVQYNLAVRTSANSERFELNRIPEDRRNVFQFNFNMYLSGMKLFNPEASLKLNSKKSADQIAMMQSPISVTDQTLYISGDIVIPVKDVVRVCCSGASDQCHLVAWIDSDDSDYSDGRNGQIDELNEADNIVEVTVPFESKICSDFPITFTIRDLAISKTGFAQSDNRLAEEIAFRIKAMVKMRIEKLPENLSARDIAEMIVSCEIRFDGECWSKIAFVLDVLTDSRIHASFIENMTIAQMFDIADTIRISDDIVYLECSVTLLHELPSNECGKHMEVEVTVCSESSEILDKKNTHVGKVICGNRLAINHVHLTPDHEVMYPTFEYRSSVSFLVENLSPENTMLTDFRLGVCVHAENIYCSSNFAEFNLSSTLTLGPFGSRELDIPFTAMVYEEVCSSNKHLKIVPGTLNFTIFHINGEFVPLPFTREVTITCSTYPIMAYLVFGMRFMDLRLSDLRIHESDNSSDTYVWDVKQTLQTSVIATKTELLYSDVDPLISDRDLKIVFKIKNGDSVTVLSQDISSSVLVVTSDTLGIKMMHSVRTENFSTVVEHCGQTVSFICEASYLSNGDIIEEISPVNNVLTSNIFIRCPGDKLVISTLNHNFYHEEGGKMLEISFNVASPDAFEFQRLTDIYVKVEIRDSDVRHEIVSNKRIEDGDVQESELTTLRKVTKLFALEKGFDFNVCCQNGTLAVELNPTVDWFEKYYYEYTDIRPVLMESRLVCTCSQFDISGVFQRTVDTYHQNLSSTISVDVELHQHHSQITLDTTLEFELCLSKPQSDVVTRICLLAEADLNDFQIKNPADNTDSCTRNMTINFIDRMRYPSVFCGDMNLRVHLDHNNLLEESDETNNIIDSTAVLKCPGDVYAISSNAIRLIHQAGTSQFLVTGILFAKNMLTAAISNSKLHLRYMYHTQPIADSLTSISLLGNEFESFAIELGNQSKLRVVLQDTHYSFATKELEIWQMMTITDSVCEEMPSYVSIIVLDDNFLDESIIQNNFLTLPIDDIAEACSYYYAYSKNLPLPSIVMSVEDIETTYAEGKIDIEIKFTITRNGNVEVFEFGNSIASLNISLGDDGSNFREVAFNQNLGLLDFNKNDGETSSHIYGSYYYKFFLVTRTFSEAKKACLDIGYRIALPKTDDAFNFLQNIGSSNYRHNSFWIGVSDVTNSGSWTWEDGTNFRLNSYDGRYISDTFSSDLCGRILMYSSIHGFKFLNCLHNAYYICEGPITGEQRMSAEVDDETLLQACKNEEIKIKAVVTMRPMGHPATISNGLTKNLDTAPLIAENCHQTFRHVRLVEFVTTDLISTIIDEVTLKIDIAVWDIAFVQSLEEFSEPFSIMFFSYMHDYMSNNSESAIIMLELPETLEMRYLLDTRIPKTSYEDFYSFSGVTPISRKDLVIHEFCDKPLALTGFFISTGGAPSHFSILNSKTVFNCPLGHFEVLELSNEGEIFLSTKIDQYESVELNANLKINDPRMPPKVFMEILSENVTAYITLLGVLSNAAFYERKTIDIVLHDVPGAAAVLESRFTLNQNHSQISDQHVSVTLTLHSILTIDCLHITHICAVKTKDILLTYPLHLLPHTCIDRVTCIDIQPVIDSFAWKVVNSKMIVPDVLQTIEISLWVHKNYFFSFTKSRYAEIMNSSLYLRNQSSTLSDELLQVEYSISSSIDMEYFGEFAEVNATYSTTLPWLYCGQFDTICVRIGSDDFDEFSTCREFPAPDQLCSCNLVDLSVNSAYLSSGFDYTNNMSNLRMAVVFDAIIDQASLISVSELKDHYISFDLTTEYFIDLKDCFSSNITGMRLQELAHHREHQFCHMKHIQYFLDGFFHFSKSCLQNTVDLFLDHQETYPSIHRRHLLAEALPLYLSINVDPPDHLIDINTSNNMLRKLIRNHNLLLNNVFDIVELKSMFGLEIIAENDIKVFRVDIFTSIVVDGAEIHPKLDIKKDLLIESQLINESLDNVYDTVSIDFIGETYYHADKLRKFAIKSHYEIANIRNGSLNCEDLMFDVCVGMDNFIHSGKICELVQPQCEISAGIDSLRVLSISMAATELDIPRILHRDSNVQNMFLGGYIKMPKYIDHRTLLLLTSYSEQPSVTLSKMVYVQEKSETHTPIAEFAISLPLLDFIRENKVKNFHLHSMLLLNESMKFSGMYELIQGPWVVGEMTTDMVRVEVVEYDFIGDHQLVFPSNQSLMMSDHFEQILPLPKYDLGAISNPTSLSLPSLDTLIHIKFILLCTDEISENMEFTAFHSERNTSLEIHTHNLTYTLLKYPQHVFGDEMSLYHKYHVDLKGSLAITHMPTEYNNHINVQFAANFTNGLVNIGKINLDDVFQSAYKISSPFILTRFEFLSGEKMIHSLQEKTIRFPYVDEKDLSQLLFYEPYILQAKYIGSGLDEVTFKTDFSSNILIKFYVETQTFGHEEKKEIVSPHVSKSTFEIMQKKIQLDQTIDLSDVTLGLALSADLCGQVNVYVEICLDDDKSSPACSPSSLSKSDASLEISCNHDRNNVKMIRTQNIPEPIGWKMLSIKHESSSSESVHWITHHSWMHVTGSKCGDVINWAAAASSDEIFDYSDVSVAILHSQILKCLPTDDGVYLYQSMTFGFDYEKTLFSGIFHEPCKLGVHILLMKIDDTNDLILSNNYIAFHVPVNCYSRQIIKIQSIQLSSEPSYCNPFRRCTRKKSCSQSDFVADFAIRVLHQSYDLDVVSDSVETHDLVVSPALPGKLLGMDSILLDDDIINGLYRRRIFLWTGKYMLTLPANNAIDNLMFQAFVMEDDCKNCTFPRHALKILSGVHSIPIDSVCEDSANSTLVSTSVKIKNIQRHVFFGYPMPVEIALSVTCNGSDCSSFMNTFRETEMQMKWETRAIDGTKGVVYYVENSSLRNHLLWKDYDKYRSQFLNIPHSKMESISDENMFTFEYVIGGFLQIDADTGRCRKEWYLGISISNKEQLFGNGNPIIHEEASKIVSICKKDWAAHVDTSIISFTSLSNLYDVSQKQPVTISLRVGVATSVEIDQEIFQDPQQSGSSGYQSQTLTYSFYISKDGQLSEDDVMVYAGITSNRARSEVWNSYLPYNQVFDIEGGIGLFQYVDIQFCSRFMNLNNTIFLIAATDKEGFYEEVIENDNNYLALELKLVGCEDGYLSVPYFHVNTKIPSILHSNVNGINIEVTSDENYYHRDGVNVDVYMNMSMSVIISNQNPFAKHEDFDEIPLISGQRLVGLFDLDHHDFNRNGLYLGSSHFTIPLNIPSHSRICGKIWKMTLYFESYTFSPITNSQTGMEQDQLVYIICDSKYASIYTDIEYALPSTVYPSIPYPIKFEVVDDIFQRAALVELNETKLDLAQIKVELLIAVDHIYVNNFTLPDPLSIHCNVTKVDADFEQHNVATIACNGIAVFEDMLCVGGQLRYLLSVSGHGTEAAYFNGKMASKLHCPDIDEDLCDAFIEETSAPDMIDEGQQHSIIDYFQLRYLRPNQPLVLSELLDPQVIIYKLKKGEISIPLITNPVSELTEADDPSLGIHVSTEIIFASDYGWNAVFCGHTEIVATINKNALHCVDPYTPNDSITKKLFIRCTDDVYHVKDVSVLPVLPWIKISCFVDTPILVMASLSFANSTFLKQAMSDGDFVWKAYISYDPLLDRTFDEAVRLRIQSSNIDADNSSSLHIRAQGNLSLSFTSCADGRQKYLIIQITSPLIDADKQWANNLFSLPLSSVANLREFDGAADDSYLVLDDFSLSDNNVVQMTESSSFVAAISSKLPRTPDGATDTASFVNLQLVIRIGNKSDTLQAGSFVIFNETIGTVVSDDELFKIQRYHVPSVTIQSTFTIPIGLIGMLCGQSHISLSVEDNGNFIIDNDKSNNYLEKIVKVQCPGDVLVWTESSFHSLQTSIDVHEYLHEDIILNPLKSSKVRMQVSVWNFGQFQLQREESESFFSIETTGNLLQYDWTVTSQQRMYWNMLEQMNFTVTFNMNVSSDICALQARDNGTTDLLDIVQQITIKPNVKFNDLYYTVDQVLYNNMKHVTFKIDCFGVADLELFPPVLTGINWLDQNSLSEDALELNKNTSVRMKMQMYHQPVSVDRLYAGQLWNFSVFDTFQTFLDRVVITVELEFSYSLSGEVKVIPLMERELADLTYTHEHTTHSAITKGFELVLPLQIDNNAVMEICSQTNIGSLKVMAFITRGSSFIDMSPLNNAHVLEELTLMNCPTETKTQLKGFQLEFMDKTISLPTRMTTASLFIQGFTTDLQVQSIKPIASFYMCARDFEEYSFANYSTFQTMMHSESCIPVKTESSIAEKEIANGQATFDGVTMFLENVALDSTIFQWCWGNVFVLVSVWDESSMEQIVAGSNLWQEEYFMDCGSKLMNECVMGVHNCTPPAFCVDKYRGFSCTCPDDLLLDQHGNCSRLSNCQTTDGDTCIVDCSRGLKYHWGDCIDVDECLDANVCPSFSTCHNTEGSFFCVCDAGFEMIGNYCIDPLNCTESACPNGICEDLLPGLRCFCNESAEGSCDEIANSWSAWSNFSECSTSCGKGIQTRYRTCDGNNCTGLDSEEIQCILTECPYGAINPCGDSLDRCDQLSGNGVCQLHGSGDTSCSCKPPHVEMFDGEGRFLYCSDNTTKSDSKWPGEVTTATVPENQKTVLLVATNCLQADVIHSKIDHSIPFSHNSEHVFLNNLYAASNGIFILAAKELPEEWIQVLTHPSVSKQFPSEFQAVFLPLWTVKDDYSDYKFTSICADTVTPTSAQHQTSLEFVNKMLDDSNLGQSEDLLQITTVTWKGYVTSLNSVNESIEFQAILATDFDVTYLAYVYGYLGSGLELVTHSFPILRGYTIPAPAASKGRFMLTDLSVEGDVKQEFLPHTLFGSTDIYKVSSNAGQDICLRWYYSEPAPPDNIESTSEICPPTEEDLFSNAALWRVTDKWTDNERFANYTQSHEDADMILKWIESDTTCYTLKLSADNGWNVDCCYLLPEGRIIRSFSEWYMTGFSRRHSDKSSDVFMMREAFPQIHCCLLGPKKTNENLCSLYTEKRPMSGYALYKPAAFTYGGGDPTFLTLDGAIFNIDKPGQYIIFQTNHLLAQCVVDCVEFNGAKINVITAMGFKIIDKAFLLEMNVFEGKLHVTSSTPKLLLGTETGTGTIAGMETFIEYEDLLIDEDDRYLCDAVNLIFSERVQFSVRAVENSISHTGHVPITLKGKTSGLMGNFDSIPSNDFLTSSNVELPGRINSRGLWVPATDEIGWEFAKSWSYQYVTANQLVDRNDIDMNNIHYYVCLGTNIQASEDAAFDAEDCNGFADIHTYEICIQQYLRAANESLMESFKKDLIRSSRTGLTPGTLPSEITCDGNLKLYHGQEGKLSCQSQVFVATFQKMVLDEGSADLSLTDDARVDYIQQKLSYILRVNATDPDFMLPSSQCGVPLQLQSSSLPAYLKNRFLLSMKENGTGSPVTSRTVNVIACFCMSYSQCVFDEATPVYKTGTELAKDYSWLKIASCACDDWQCGQWCDGLLDPCSMNPCYPDVSCISSGRSFTCGSCSDNMAGDGMQCDQPLCRDFADAPQCPYNCIVVNGSPKCTCPAGQVLAEDGVQCEDVDECEANPLLCKQFKSYCNNTFGSYLCLCQIGFQKIYKSDGDFVCNDVDECETENGGCMMRCRNNYGSYSCGCAAGFELTADGETCQDIDECDIGHKCSQNCINTYGLYECSCNDGFTLDDNKVTCSPLEKCDDEVRISRCGLENTICSIKDGEPSCGCENGYQLRGGLCSNIDECRARPDICGAQSECIDIEGGYNCLCAEGYEMTDGVSGCTNIDECSYHNGGCEQKCNDIVGSFLCTCYNGYILSEDGSTCVDIEECDAAILSNCHEKAECFNFEGSYSCKCREGYTGNGIICSDIDECEILNGRCSYLCVNTEQSYYCTCPEGFQLEADGRQCVDVDECSKNDLNQCQGLSICHNLSPSYICSCPDGYSKELDMGNTTCIVGRELSIILARNYEVKQECESCQEGCVVKEFNTEYAVTCVCPEGYTLAEDGLSCSDIDECTLNRIVCSEYSLCTNQVGSYSCDCLPGFQFSDEFGTRCDLSDDYAWSRWGRWTECPADCDYALELRSRRCVSRDGESSLCEGNPNDYKVCAMVNCEDIREEEDQSVQMIFASIRIMDWLLDMKYGIGFWVSEALLRYCEQKDKFPQCCNGRTPTVDNIVSSQIISNADDIVNSGYPISLPRNSGIKVKLSARMHRNSKFCSFNSDQPSTDEEVGSRYVDPGLLLAALREFNNSNDEVYMKYMPVEMKLGRRPPDPEPLADPGYFAAIATLVLMCVMVHAYRLVPILKAPQGK